MIKVLIVDDSPSARLALRKAIERDHELLVVGEAATGAQSLELCGRLDPDIVTLDLFLGEENGLDVASTIMHTRPRPLVIVTGADPTTPWITYRAIERGALEVLGKLPAPNDPAYARRAQDLTRTLKCLAQVPTIHRERGWPAQKGLPAQPPPDRRAGAAAPGAPPAARSTPPRIVLVGASTGGPPVVQKLLGVLPPPLPVPLVVVQHISEGFAVGFASWLGDLSGHPTSVITEPRRLEAGTVYVAADEHDAVFRSTSEVEPAPSEPRATICPSISRLFASGARTFGSTALAVLLTGMGRDGAEGLAALAAAGAQTAVQAPETCVVPSMPESAIRLGAAAYVLPPPALGAWLARSLRLEPRT